MNRLYEKLEQEVLGSFDLFNNTKIYDNEEEIITSTYIHEEAHRKMISSTSFGEIQQMFAYISKQGVSNCSLDWINSADNILSHTIRLSIFAHEGYAVWRQIENGKIFSSVCDLDLMPELYRDFYQKYKAVIEKLSMSMHVFNLGIARAISEAVFNTTILRDINITNFKESLYKHLSNEINQPDYRFEEITKILTTNGISQHCQDNLLKEFTVLIKSMGITYDGTVNDMLLRMYTEPYNYPILIEKWDKIETEILFDELKNHPLPFLVISPIEIQDEIHSFHIEIKNYLEKFGVRLYEKRGPLNFAEAAFHSEQVEYIPKKVLKEYIIPIFESKELIETLVNDPEIFFILEIGRIKSKMLKKLFEGDFFYHAYLTPIAYSDTLNEEKSSSEATVAFKVTGEQCALFGDLNDLKQLYFKVYDKTLMLLIDWATVVVENFTIPTELEEFFKLKKIEPTVVAQGTSSNAFFRQLISCADIGIAAGTIIGKTERMVYFYFELLNGLQVVLKCTDIMLNILRQHKLKEWDSIEPYCTSNNNLLKKIANSKYKSTYLQSILALDRYGAFFHQEY